jgi:hypothetical protein
MKRWTIVLLTLALLTSAMPVGAAPTGKQLLRNLLRRDFLRDRTLPVRRLKAPRTVHRYTTWERALRELQKGLPVGTHTTARARPGRPPSPEAAQRRYGLPRKPEVRETIRLPEGTPVRRGKVLGGRRGVGEINTARRVPPEAIRKITPLPRKP